jgi:Fe-S-cluster containining protein
MDCRPGCGACCIAPSISSPIPGMPVVDGISKPAGVRCVQLDAANLNARRSAASCSLRWTCVVTVTCTHCTTSRS